MRREQELTGWDDRDGPGVQPDEQLGLGRGDRLDRPEELEVDRADADDHAHVGLGDLGELGDLAGAAHRHLEHEHLGSGGRGQDLERQTDLGVEVGARGDGAAVGREQRQQQILGRGLARRPGDADHLSAELAPPGGGEAVHGPERVVGGDQRAGHGAPGGLGVLGRRQHPPRAGGERLRREPAAVVVLALEAYEQRSGAGLARVDDRALGTRRDGRRRDEPGPCRPCQLLGCPGPHALIREGTGRLGRLTLDRLGRDGFERFPRDGHVVERDLASAFELLPLLVALAGDDHHVARPRAGDRRVDRGAAIGVVLDVRCRRRRGSLR